MPNINFNLYGAKHIKHQRNNIHGEYGKIYKNANVEYGRFSKYRCKSGVYGIKNKITKKVYIGSSKDLQRRFLKHFNELFHNRHRTKLLQQDFNKYGIDSFDIIIYEYTDDNLLQKEKEFQLLESIDNLYNEQISGHYITEELKQIRKNTSKATHKTKEYREKMSKMKTNLIGEFDINMKLIKIWESAIKICEEKGYTRSVILSCCNGSKKWAYRRNWRYVDKDGNIIENGYNKARKQN